MPARLKFIVAYDGTGFAGWQSQPNGHAIQDHLELAVHRVSGERARVHGAGRTDTGVHALGQCAQVDLANRRLPPVKWLGALNASLPPTIRVLRCSYARQDFHARYSAKGKVYRYRICPTRILLPLEYNRAWHVPSPIDFNLLRTAAAKFAGKHDFAGFAANRGKTVATTIRNITSVRVRKMGSCITIDFEGDGFLYKMVRLMVGAIVQCATGKLSINEMVTRLGSGFINGPRPAAPAAGLHLLRVRY